MEYGSEIGMARISILLFQSRVKNQHAGSEAKRKES
jgi:hypothetical protein